MESHVGSSRLVQCGTASMLEMGCVSFEGISGVDLRIALGVFRLEGQRACRLTVLVLS